ncbi:zinc finger protein ZAT9-like [Cynara cardunculus var. scolymus]|uniref:zinc finger protein ZAT9-like n=1 Tax=Cynara cardunculus var. scolymus TaxID=59895 RepID=UPI000D6258B5|nr:zinc finger protein ZAT9-like [Cynara cardunculus var. scolymus]
MSNSVEQSDQELMKHMCKLCNKSFPCGRSLGGHMRSHVINSTDHHHKMKLSSLNNNGENLIDNNTSVTNVSSNSNDLGYELRKDPKRTLKAKISSEAHNENNSLVVLDKLCKECGKGFQSWKALFGHMKCHSDKVSNTKTAILNQDSSISQSNNENSSAKSSRMKKSRSRNGTTKGCIVTCGTTPTVTTTTTTTTDSSSVSMNANHASTSVVYDNDQEQEAEVAMCLMMLSRDVGKWGDGFECKSPTGFVKLTKVQSKKLTGNGCKMKKLAETEVGVDSLGRSEVGSYSLEKTIINQDEFDDQNEFGFAKFEGSIKRKFDCTACNKSFHSYQALGGHRASHKKLKGCFDSKNDHKNKIESEPILDHDQMINGCSEKTSDHHQSTSSFNLVGSLKNTMVVGAHECSICLRIFSSGQALGGHKRSHLIAEAKLNQQNLKVIEKVKDPVHEIRGFLDLNMPPEPVEEEEQEQEETMMMNTSTTGYNPWCYNHESTLLGLLSTS